MMMIIYFIGIGIYELLLVFQYRSSTNVDHISDHIDKHVHTMFKFTVHNLLPHWQMATSPMTLSDNHLFFIDIYSVLLDPFKHFLWLNDLIQMVSLNLRQYPGRANSASIVITYLTKSLFNTLLISRSHGNVCSQFSDIRK
jgi:hypothetical protein